jgi:hypothetical protein
MLSSNFTGAFTTDACVFLSTAANSGIACLPLSLAREVLYR